MFSTPYRSQRLYLRIGSSNHFNDSVEVEQPPSPAAASKLPAHHSKRHRTLRAVHETAILQNEEGEKEVDSWTDISFSSYFGASIRSDGNLLLGGPEALQGLVRRVLKEYSSNRERQLVNQQEQKQQQYRKKKRRRASELLPLSSISTFEQTALQTNNSSHLEQQQQQQGLEKLFSALGIVGGGLSPARSREVKLTSPTLSGFLSVIVTDQPLQPHHIQQPHSPANTSQASDGSMSSYSNSSNRSSSSESGKAGTSDEFLVSIAIGQALLPDKFTTMQSSAQPPSLLLSLNSSTTSSQSSSHLATTGRTDCQFTVLLSSTAPSAAGDVGTGVSTQTTSSAVTSSYPYDESRTQTDRNETGSSGSTSASKSNNLQRVDPVEEVRKCIGRLTFFYYISDFAPCRNFVTIRNS